ncbi:trypsin-like peptidase domain-containing protein [Promicromonospora sp. NPDC050262]|uniref:S1C family serine protease n=1 Tax=Promicromonospora sp. NPDC050262 TaxID=3155036 RepID=UPI0033F33CB9
MCAQRSPEAGRRGWRGPALAAGAALAALALGLAGGVLGARLAAAPDPAGACDVAEVAPRVLPTIVTISATGAGSGTGSGAILTEDGAVVTNDHVITPAVPDGRIEVILADGERLPAELVGRDPQTDLAVLNVEPGRALPTIELAGSDDVAIGEPVVALGAPLGLSSTVTAGIVSATGRSVTVPTGEGGTTVLTGAIQTDASINPGNSGGALVDCDGRLVGVNTAISTVPDSAGQPVGGSVGIGFAVPVGTVRAITDELLEHGRVEHPSFGMTVSALPPSAAARLGVPPGLVVTGLTDGGSAQAAGLRVGDLITSLDGQAAPTDSTLAHVVVHAVDGDEVEVDVLRDGRSRQVTVTLR